MGRPSAPGTQMWLICLITHPCHRVGMQKLLHILGHERAQGAMKPIPLYNVTERRSCRLCQENKRASSLCAFFGVRHHFTRFQRRSLCHDGYHRATTANSHKGERCNCKPHTFFFRGSIICCIKQEFLEPEIIEFRSQVCRVQVMNPGQGILLLFSCL